MALPKKIEPTVVTKNFEPIIQQKKVESVAHPVAQQPVAAKKIEPMALPKKIEPMMRRPRKLALTMQPKMRPPVPQQTPFAINGKQAKTREDIAKKISNQFGGLDNFLKNSLRRIVDMPGDNNNCGFHAILSNVKKRYSAGDVIALRKLVGITGSKMFETDSNHAQIVADHYNRPIVAITRSGDAINQVELIIPDCDRRLFVCANSLTNNSGKLTTDLSTNFREWLCSYLRDESDLTAVVDSLVEKMRPHMAEKFDLSAHTILKTMLNLHKNPKTISIIHSGAHFMGGLTTQR
jgi:hypothetical protein